MGEFRMPSLGADMDSGTIVEWRVRPGDTVHRGDIVAVVDTDKADIDVEVFEDGVVAELLVEPGIEVAVGTPLATIEPSPGPDAPPVETARERHVPPAAGTGTQHAPSEPPPPQEVPVRARSRSFTRASPRARREAATQGVDLSEVDGSGPGGAVLHRDVVGGAPPSPVPPRTVEAPRRNATAELMARSKREIPHYYLATTIDLGRALGWLAEVNGSRSAQDRLIPAALLLKATALAAAEVTSLNGVWDGELRPSTEVHLGVAVSRRGGELLTPTISAADRLSVDELMSELRGVVERVRSGRLRSSDTVPGTITVTNLGDQGADEVFGVIHPPQVAVVGFGRIVERPWVRQGTIEVRPVVRATLSADHRASDGHTGSRLLSLIDRSLQTPEEL